MKLHHAAQHGETNDTRRVLKKATLREVNFRDPNHAGATALVVAVFSGHFAIVKLLVVAKAVVDLANNEGVTPLFISAQNGHIDALKCLIGAKAAVDQAMNNGATPLYMSAQNGHIGIAKTLIQRGADPTLEAQHGGQGWTAQQVATACNHPEIAAYLEEATRATTNLTPLHHACFTRNASRLLALFRSDAVPSAMLDQPALPGGTPVEIAEASVIGGTTIEMLPVCERSL